MAQETEDVKDVKASETETGATDTQVDEKQSDIEEMVSKAEAQKMADAMVAKKLKGMPSKEELAKYKEWKEAQKTEAEKRAEQEEKYRAIEAENTSLKQERLIVNKGVKVKDVDYVLFKVNKMEGDFEDNLVTFLNENPEYLNATPQKVATDGTAVKRGVEPKTNTITDLLKKKHPDIKL